MSRRPMTFRVLMTALASALLLANGVSAHAQSRPEGGYQTFVSNRFVSDTGITAETRCNTDTSGATRELCGSGRLTTGTEPFLTFTNDSDFGPVTGSADLRTGEVTYSAPEGAGGDVSWVDNLTFHIPGLAPEDEIAITVLIDVDGTLRDNVDEGDKFSAAIVQFGAISSSFTDGTLTVYAFYSGSQGDTAATALVSTDTNGNWIQLGPNRFLGEVSITGSDPSLQLGLALNSAGNETDFSASFSFLSLPAGTTFVSSSQTFLSDTSERPIADAGPDDAAQEGETVTLDGSGSTDDGDPLTSYDWTQIAGPPVIDFDGVTDPVRPTFVAPAVARSGAIVTFELIVGDGTDVSDPDTVDITIKNVNQLPVADAGDSGTFPESSVVSLNGSNSFDPDGDPLTCTWTQIDGQSVTIIDPSACVTTFTAPAVVSGESDILTFQLVVNDVAADSAPDTVEIEIINTNQPPVADAGGPGPLTRDEGTMVTLDGSGSSDPDGDPLFFLWEQTSGPAVTLANETSVVASFEAPAVVQGGEELGFKLTVDDGEFSNMAAVTVLVRNVNDPPNCAHARPSRHRLWPPSHKLRKVRIKNLADPDDDSIRVRITSVFQDEPVNGLGDGNTSPDAVIRTRHPKRDHALIRAERSRVGNGRVYHIAFTAFDGFESCDGEVQVKVPLRRKGTPAVDDGALFDSTLP